MVSGAVVILESEVDRRCLDCLRARDTGDTDLTASLVDLGVADFWALLTSWLFSVDVANMLLILRFVVG